MILPLSVTISKGFICAISSHTASHSDCIIGFPSQKNQRHIWVGIVNESNIKRWNIDIRFFFSFLLHRESWRWWRDQKRIWKGNSALDIHTWLPSLPRHLKPKKNLDRRCIIKTYSRYVISRVCIIMFILFWRASKSDFYANASSSCQKSAESEEVHGNSGSRVRKS